MKHNARTNVLIDTLLRQNRSKQDYDLGKRLEKEDSINS